MQWLIAVLALVVSFRVAQVLLTLQKPTFDFLYTRSPAATVFLRAFIGDHYWIFTKTRIVDIVDIRPDLSSHAHRISAKHFDFVLYRPRDFSIARVIEPNNALHLEQERARRDTQVRRHPASL